MRHNQHHYSEPSKRTNINTWLTAIVGVIMIIGFIGPWYVFPERLTNQQAFSTAIALRVTALELKSESSGTSLARVEEKLSSVNERTERIEALLLGGFPRRTYNRQSPTTTP